MNAILTPNSIRMMFFNVKKLQTSFVEAARICVNNWVFNVRPKWSMSTACTYVVRRMQNQMMHPRYLDIEKLRYIRDEVVTVAGNNIQKLSRCSEFKPIFNKTATITIYHEFFVEGNNFIFENRYAAMISKDVVVAAMGRTIEKGEMEPGMLNLHVCIIHVTIMNTIHTTRGM